MGCYDTFAGVQLKNGPCECIEFEIGDEVPLPDGIYVGFEGVVVIIAGILKARFEFINSKWDREIRPAELIAEENPVAQAIKETVNKIKSAKGKK